MAERNFNTSVDKKEVNVTDMNFKEFLSNEEDTRWNFAIEILYYCGLRKG